MVDKLSIFRKIYSRVEAYMFRSLLNNILYNYTLVVLTRKMGIISNLIDILCEKAFFCKEICTYSSDNQLKYLVFLSSSLGSTENINY